MANPYYDLIPQLDAQKASGKTSIDASTAAALAAIAKTQGDWGAQQPGYAAATGNAYSTALAQVTGEADRIARDLTAQGVTNQSPVSNQLGFTQSILAGSRANQDALTNRIQQVFAGQLADRTAGANEIAQSGTSSLETNYQQALAQLQARGAQWDADQAAAASRGGGGSGSDIPTAGDAGLLAQAGLAPTDYAAVLSGKLGTKFQQARLKQAINSGALRSDLSNINQILGQEANAKQSTVKKIIKIAAPIAAQAKKDQLAAATAALRGY